MNPARPIKVAVIGGGCASLAAAFELSRPEHQGRFEITVYQVGWRLGGKGASGRGPAGRIEEHGLHLWMGFYENAFRLMRECYAELARPAGSCPIVDWRDAFEPAPLVAVAERLGEDTWLPWVVSLPRTEGLPGDPNHRSGPFTSIEYFRQAVALLRSLLESLANRPGDRPASSSDASQRTGASFASSIGPGEQVREPLARWLRYGELATLAALIEGVNALQALLGTAFGGQESAITRFLEALGTNARSQLEARAKNEPEVRRLWTIIDLTLATLLGMVRFGVITDPRGFDSVDDYDCREWLMLNGASRQSVDSGYMRGLYDLVFAYEDGDPTRPRISAGQALRSMARSFFTYRGSFFWRMRAGMGDVVFAPLYEVLARRGVRFQFFHRLESVRLGSSARGERPFVAALDFDVQAEVRGGADYRPLCDVGGLPCWPSRADFGQLVDGELLEHEGREFESFWDPRRVGTRSLRVGEDFDFVVLGIGIGAIPHVCREILTRDARWRAMVDHVKTVATQAFQIWLEPDVRELGWRAPPVTLSGFVEPFDTWADMRHLLPRESWKRLPGTLAYFCNALPDGGQPSGRTDGSYSGRMHEIVRANAVAFLERDLRHLWPRAVRPDGAFRWDLLVDPREEPDLVKRLEGVARFESQFWTANVNPSDRYALSVPGSSAYRISPLDETYDNLTVAGDWTACGFNAGCVEAAVMSGRLAAHALSQSPPLEDIVGYDHP